MSLSQNGPPKNPTKNIKPDKTINMRSFYIPRLQLSVTQTFIQEVFQDVSLGSIEHVTFIAKPSNNGMIRSAFIYFKEDSPFLYEAANRSRGCRILYSSCDYWLVLPNKDPKYYTGFEQNIMIEKLKSSKYILKTELEKKDKCIKELRDRELITLSKFQALKDNYNKLVKNVQLQDHYISDIPKSDIPKSDIPKSFNISSPIKPINPILEISDSGL